MVPKWLLFRLENLEKLRTSFSQWTFHTQVLPLQTRIILIVTIGPVDQIHDAVSHSPVFNRAYRLTVEDRHHVIPYNLLSLSHFENVAMIRGCNKNIPVRKPLGRN